MNKINIMNILLDILIFCCILLGTSEVPLRGATKLCADVFTRYPYLQKIPTVEMRPEDRLTTIVISRHRNEKLWLRSNGETIATITFLQKKEDETKIQIQTKEGIAILTYKALAHHSQEELAAFIESKQNTMPGEHGLIITIGDYNGVALTARNAHGNTLVAFIRAAPKSTTQRYFYVTAPRWIQIDRNEAGLTPHVPSDSPSEISGGLTEILHEYLK